MKYDTTHLESSLKNLDKAIDFMGTSSAQSLVENIQEAFFEVRECMEEIQTLFDEASDE